jgi:endonuclease/exonuclease/phosphatase family metal-dependent hydrolase
MDDDYANIPFLMGGDYNCNTASEALTTVQDAGFTCSRELAAQKNDTNGSHTYCRYDPTFETYTLVYTPNKKHGSAIDHIFVSDGATINSFASVSVPYALYTSDHCPMVTDFTIN